MRARWWLVRRRQISHQPARNDLVSSNIASRNLSTRSPTLPAAPNHRDQALVYACASRSHHGFPLQALATRRAAAPSATPPAEVRKAHLPLQATEHPTLQSQGVSFERTNYDAACAERYNMPWPNLSRLERDRQRLIGAACVAWATHGFDQDVHVRRRCHGRPATLDEPTRDCWCARWSQTPKMQHSIALISMHDAI